jgi:cation diffusion facilitator CzcD-associated flavoprotein CzcO
MHVCVIGAGVSGLVSCKALRDHGVEHTCFEASDDVGGNWYEHDLVKREIPAGQARARARAAA